MNLFPKRNHRFGVCHFSGNLLLLLLLFFLIILSLSSPARASERTKAGTGESRLEIRNQSGKEAAIFWIHPVTGELQYLASLERYYYHNNNNDYENDEDFLSPFAINTFVGHQFQIKELPNNININDKNSNSNNNNETGECGGGVPCKVITVTVKVPNHEIVYLTSDFKIKTQGDDSWNDDFDTNNKSNNSNNIDPIVYCKELAKEQLSKHSTLALNSNKYDEIQKQIRQRVFMQLQECIHSKIGRKLLKAQEEKQFEHEIRESVSTQMENFTCSDPNYETTPDVYDDVQQQQPWTSSKDNITRTVHIKLDRPTSQIHVISNFASIEECNAMEEVAKPKLQDAAVADGKGGSQLSKHRRAKQAGITPDFSTSEEEELANGNLVAILSRRVYEYTNHVLGLNITEHGQEPLMSIQYFGRGLNDTEPDKYSPHCDGRCDGLPHFYGSRMATMVIYCTIPERGGHTNFQNAGVHIKPEALSAIFFSYIDPKTNLTDYGLTQHSGCPVYEGEKKIITQWVRYGVDGDERHHDNFNSLDVLFSETGDD